jgi:hypothetical protein
VVVPQFEIRGKWRRLAVYVSIETWASVVNGRNLNAGRRGLHAEEARQLQEARRGMNPG